MQEAQELLAKAADAIPSTEESVLLADYGSSASATSATILAPAVTMLVDKQVLWIPEQTASKQPSIPMRLMHIAIAWRT